MQKSILPSIARENILDEIPPNKFLNHWWKLDKHEHNPYSCQNLLWEDYFLAKGGGSTLKRLLSKAVSLNTTTHLFSIPKL
jgi:hypothetical protein